MNHAASSDHPLPQWLARRWALGVTAIVILAAVIGLSGILNDRPLDTHEMYVAQTAREMIASGDWVHPTFNAQPRLNKPPLQYWLVAGLASMTGEGARMSPWVARLPSLAAGLGLALITIALGRAIYGRTTGFLAAVLFIGTIGFFKHTNSARAEMLYALTCTATLLCFVRAFNADDRSRPQQLWALGGWALFGVCVLAKGPHVPALMLLGFGVGVWMLGERTRLLRILRPFTGLPLAILVCGGWIAAMLLANEGMVAHWRQQLFAGRPVDPEKGVFNFLSAYYFYAFPAMMLPASVLLLFGLCVAWQRGRPDLRRGLMLLMPIAVTVLVMGFSNHRRDYYLLPIAGPLCILMARGILDFGARIAHRRRWSPSRPANLLLCLTAIPCLVVIAVGSTRAAWSADRWLFVAFATEIASRVAIGDRFYVYRTNEDRFVYYLPEPVQLLKTPEQLVAAADSPILVAFPATQLADLPSSLQAEVLTRVDFTGSDAKPLVLARVSQSGGG